MYPSYGACLYCVLVTAVVVVRRSAARPTTLPSRDWCTDKLGERRSLYEVWVEHHNRRTCECIYPESLSYAWDLRNPSDASPHCQLNGCNNRVDGSYMVKGDTFTKNRSTCTCTKGPDPNLMDYSTAYHLSCVAELQDISDVINGGSQTSGLTLQGK